MYALPGIKDRVAIVTGHKGGMGAAIFKLLQEQGARVYGMDLPEIDLTNTQSIVKQVATIAQQEEGHIDILINNAGCILIADILETTPEDFDRIININLKAPFYMMQAVLPYMLKNKRGAIVNNTSDLAFIGRPQCAIYGASKAALAQLTKGAALDYCTKGIRINSVAPGSTDTPMLRRVMAELHARNPDIIPNQDEFFQKFVPLKRFADPREIAWAMLFLASDAASFMTGTVVPVDGGIIAE